MAKDVTKEEAPKRAFFAVDSAYFMPWCGAERIKFNQGLLETDNEEFTKLLRAELPTWGPSYNLREVSETEFQDLANGQMPAGFENGAVEVPRSDFLDKLKEELGGLPGSKS